MPHCALTLGDHFAAPEGPDRAEIFGLYAKHLPLEQRSHLGEAAKGLSGRDILDVCRQAERRWVCKLLRGEVIETCVVPSAACGPCACTIVMCG